MQHCKSFHLIRGERKQRPCLGSDFTPRETPDCCLSELFLGSHPSPSRAGGAGWVCTDPTRSPRGQQVPHHPARGLLPAKPSLAKLGASQAGPERLLPRRRQGYTSLPYACQRTAGLLWLHVCNLLKKTPRLAYSAVYKRVIYKMRLSSRSARAVVFMWLKVSADPFFSCAAAAAAAATASTIL